MRLDNECLQAGRREEPALHNPGEENEHRLSLLPAARLEGGEWGEGRKIYQGGSGRLVGSGDKRSWKGRGVGSGEKGKSRKGERWGMEIGRR